MDPQAAENLLYTIEAPNSWQYDVLLQKTVVVNAIELLYSSQNTSSSP